MVLVHPLFDGTRREAMEQILGAARRRDGGAAFFCNAHMAVEGLRLPTLRRAMATAEWVLSDGVPLVKALRLLGSSRAERIAGMDAVPELCRRARQENLRVYFYGGSAAVLTRLERRLGEDFPGLAIAGMASPPFRALSPDEEAMDVADIEASGAHLCFVGLGCPKQELWIARNRSRTGAVLLGVGAALNTAGGSLRMAPEWMRAHGLEWLYRLGQEPRRLGRRYAATNPLFVNRLLRQLWAR